MRAQNTLWTQDLGGRPGGDGLQGAPLALVAGSAGLQVGAGGEDLAAGE